MLILNASSFISVLQTNAFVPASSVPFYVLIICCFILIYLKINQSQYIKNLWVYVFNNSNQFDASIQSNFTNLSSFLLQFIYLLLVTLGVSFIKKWNPNLSDFVSLFCLILIFYIIQLIGFFLITNITKLGSGSIIRNRLFLNEAISLFLFIALPLAIYLPFSNTGVIWVVFGVSFLFNLIRISVYLQGIISVFHIILYLCALEIIPVLILLKFI